MSIFRREDPSPPSRSSTPPAREPQPGTPPARNLPNPSTPTSQAGPRSKSHIAPGCRIRGEVEGRSDLVVDGEIEGQIRVQSDVAIGREGTVKGDVSASSVLIGGRVVGNVVGKEKVEILDSGRLEGDVIAPRVVLAEGAFFKGKVEMTGNQPPQGTRSS